MEILVIGFTLGFNYALMAFGFSLIFSIMKLLNLAHGDLYMLGAFATLFFFSILKINIILCIIIAIVFVFFMGFFIEKIAFRPLRYEAHFMPLLSTIAVSTILQALILLIAGPAIYPFPNILGNKSVRILSLTVSFQELLIIIVSLVILIGFHYLLSKSNLGRSIRIAGYNIVLASLLGVNVNKVFSVTFGLGSALGAVAAILTSFLYGGVFTTMGFLPMFKGFTASIIGGMGSMSGAVMGAMFLGFVEAFGGRYLPSGYADAIVFIFLLFFLIIKPTGFFGSKEIIEGRGRELSYETRKITSLASLIFSKRKANKYLIPLIILLIIFFPFISTDYWTRIVILITLYGVLALSLNIVIGYGGLISLGHASFYAMGAYITGILSVKFGLPFYITLPASCIAAFVLGIILGLITLRLSGYYLCIVTLGFSEIFRIILMYWVSLTGGQMGIRGIPSPIIFSFFSKGIISYYYYGILLLFITAIFCYHFSKSTVGKITMAVRDNEIASLSLGISINYYKIMVFALGGLFASMAGNLYAYYVSFISPEIGSVWETVTVMAMIIIGGVATVSGPILGAAILVLVPELVRPIGKYHLLIYGFTLLMIILFRPQGLFVKREKVATTS